MSTCPLGYTVLILDTLYWLCYNCVFIFPCLIFLAFFPCNSFTGFSRSLSSWVSLSIFQSSPAWSAAACRGNFLFFSHSADQCQADPQPSAQQPWSSAFRTEQFANTVWSSGHFQASSSMPTLIQHLLVLTSLRDKNFFQMVCLEQASDSAVTLSESFICTSIALVSSLLQSCSFILTSCWSLLTAPQFGDLKLQIQLLSVSLQVSGCVESEPPPPPPPPSPSSLSHSSTHWLPSAVL